MLLNKVASHVHVQRYPDTREACQDSHERASVRAVGQMIPAPVLSVIWSRRLLLRAVRSSRQPFTIELRGLDSKTMNGKPVLDGTRLREGRRPSDAEFHGDRGVGCGKTSAFRVA